MITTTVLLLCVASSVCVNIPYPGLTEPEARCPENPSDLDYWYLSSYYQKIPRCFGRYPLPDNLNEPADLIEVCRKKHKDAMPASLHSDDELWFISQFGLAEETVIGLHIPPNASLEESSLLNLDKTLVDFKVVDFNSAENSSDVVIVSEKVLKLTKLSSFTKDVQHKYVMCVTYGYPRVLEAYNRTPEPTPDLTQYYCEDDGWDLQAPCGGTPFCYQEMTLDKSSGITKKLMAELNQCGMEVPGSFLATAHCEAEQEYLVKRDYNSIKYTGYYIPGFCNWNRFNSWKASDGKPVNYIKWYKFEPSNFWGKLKEEDNKLSALRYTDAWDDQLDEDAHYKLCKKPAVKKEQPLMKIYETFEKEGKKCRKEPASHWNHRCPTNSDIWRIVESDAGIHCYGLVPVPMPLTSRNFTHNVCKKLHPHSKLASIHNDDQLGIINSQYNKDNVIVGMIYEYNEYNWLDGTPMNTSFWAPSQPSNVTGDIVARIQQTKYYVSELTKFRPFFVVESMSSVTSDMQIACQVDAEPLLPCTPVPDTDNLKTLDDATCDAGWDKLHLCDKVYCYKTVNINDGSTFETIFERDYCNNEYPGSYLASIHCREEHFWVQGLAEKIIIGLHIPKNLQNVRDFKNFRWTDGTPVDFVGWNRYSNLVSADNLMEPLFSDTSVQLSFKPGYHAYNKGFDNSSGWTNIDYGFDGRQALCKKPYNCA